MNSDANRIDQQQLERVLERLGFSASPEIDLHGLSRIYAAWCRSVPFDNMCKLVHVRSRNPAALPGDNAQDFFTTWLDHGTGGTCWAGNGALCSLLEAIGFSARRGLCTMLAVPNAPPNHGTVIVDLNGADHIVDASILHHDPLPLHEHRQSSVAHPSWGVHCWHDGSHWQIRYRPMHLVEGMDCRIEKLAIDAREFSERHATTREWSPFNYELHARLIVGDTIVGVARSQRIEYRADGSVSMDPIDHAERLRVLIDELGISEEMAQSIPEDMPTPPPPGSRTAQAMQ